MEGFQVGRKLKDKVQQRLVNKTVEGKTSYYQITGSGRQWVEAERERIQTIASDEQEPPAAAPPAAAPAAAAPAVATFPSQADTFRRDGLEHGFCWEFAQGQA